VWCGCGVGWDVMWCEGSGFNSDIGVLMVAGEL
jgi:hypothetical protein